MAIDKSRGAGSLLLQAIEAVAISPERAKSISKKYMVGNGNDDGSSEMERSEAADKIITRFARNAGAVGVVTALPAVIPGIGTGISIGLGAPSDIVACMKLQVDMCMCLASVYGLNVDVDVEVRYRVYLAAAVGTIVHKSGGKIAIRAAERLLREHLKGAALQGVKQAFKQVGIVFTRKSVERIIPLGIGAAIGGLANYGLTVFVGKRTKKDFEDLTGSSVR